MLEEVSMEKQKDQEFAHLEVKRLCGVFGAPLPPVEEKPVDTRILMNKHFINTQRGGVKCRPISI